MNTQAFRRKSRYLQRGGGEGEARDTMHFGDMVGVWFGFNLSSWGCQWGEGERKQAFRHRETFAFPFLLQR